MCLISLRLQLAAACPNSSYASAPAYSAGVAAAVASTRLQVIQRVSFDKTKGLIETGFPGLHPAQNYELKKDELLCLSLVKAAAAS